MQRSALLLTTIVAAAFVVSSPWWLTEALLRWTDYTVRHTTEHLAGLKEGAHADTAKDYWPIASALVASFSAVVAFLGFATTVIVIMYASRQLGLATLNMRSTARQQQMRLLFDLDLALLNHPDVCAMIEGHTELDHQTLSRAKSSTFAHAFLNGCDTVYDYYRRLDSRDHKSYWGAWRAQLEHHLEHRPELRAIARQSIDRKLYTDDFREELEKLVRDREAESKARHSKEVVTVTPPPPRGADASTRELSGSADDVATLTAFYETVYLREFPNADERELLGNMIDYVGVKKPAGWYGFNNYHLVIAEVDGLVAGLCVSDYLSEANVGVIEFLVVAPDCRGRGIGTKLMKHTEGLLAADARRAHGTGISGIVAEMEDPFRQALSDNGIDPFDRAEMWHEWEYRIVDLPYVQPALSVGTEAVEGLLLLARPQGPPVDSWPVGQVLATLRGYMKYAMRIDEPVSNPAYVAMAGWLAGRKQVRLLSLGKMIGRRPRVRWAEILDRNDPLFGSAMRSYKSAFKGDLSISDEEFGAFLDLKRSPHLRYSYHLWTIRARYGDGVTALASFFSLARCGFGGYAWQLGGPGNAARASVPVALASVEERMLRDNPRLTGMFVECSPSEERQPATIFRYYGFREVAIDYRQPPLPGSMYSVEQAPRLLLLYKPFGRPHGGPGLTVRAMLAGMEDVLEVVYGISRPASSPFHRHIRQQLSLDGDAGVPFRTGKPSWSSSEAGG